MVAHVIMSKYDFNAAIYKTCKTKLTLNLRNFDKFTISSRVHFETIALDTMIK